MMDFVLPKGKYKTPQLFLYSISSMNKHEKVAILMQKWIIPKGSASF